jgi:hypothetical protein
MNYDIPARSRLVPAIPITNPQFVYRRARETDVQATFARVRAKLEHSPDEGKARATPAGSTQPPNATNP